VNENTFINTIYRVVEHLIKIELSSRGKKLVIYYFNQSNKPNTAGRAREAVERYTQTEIPTLDEIKKKNKLSELSELDHLILKMEYEAQNSRE
jgi:hypothetical protein